jgi:hypothetical protein
MTKLKHMFPPRPCPKHTLITTSRAPYDSYSTQQEKLSECVCVVHPLCSCINRYYEETGSNPNSTSTEKNLIFIPYKQGGN